MVQNEQDFMKLNLYCKCHRDCSNAKVQREIDYQAANLRATTIDRVGIR